jgi:hypothetical protein
MFFLALFRQKTRDAIMSFLETVLPAQITGVRLEGSLTKTMHQLVNRQILQFQEEVSSSSRRGGRWRNLHRVAKSV